MWLTNDSGELINSKYLRRIAVREGKAARHSRDGSSSTEYKAIPATGFVVVGYNGGPALIAHRDTKEQCEAILKEIQRAIKAGENAFDVNDYPAKDGHGRIVRDPASGLESRIL